MPDRELIGYSGQPPHPEWPDGARVALQFVLNIEEGAERTILNGDQTSESYLHEVYGKPARTGERDLSVESMYEYGARAGTWRLLELFNTRGLPITAFATGRALELTPEIGQAMANAGHEIAGHGYRWIDYRQLTYKQEQDHIARTIRVIDTVCGQRPVGWYTGRASEHTLRLLQEEGGFHYCSDAYNDDLPYWRTTAELPQLIIPYTLVNNDVRYLWPNGFASGADFLQQLKDAFDLLWQEGERHPKMMSIGLHGRISGHPARTMALVRFLDYVQAHDLVWICRREQIAQHWMASHPYCS